MDTYTLIPYASSSCPMEQAGKVCTSESIVTVSSKDNKEKPEEITQPISLLRRSVHTPSLISDSRSRPEIRVKVPIQAAFGNMGPIYWIRPLSAARRQDV